MDSTGVMRAEELSAFERGGFHILSEALSDVLKGRLANLIEDLKVGQGAKSIRKNDDAFAARNILDSSESIAMLLRQSPFLDAVRDGLPGACAVRGIVFDKPFKANWFVPWHQDTTIAVRDRHDVQGFNHWTVKAGIPHVRPPVPILERMLTLRLHLDAAHESNGALIVVPGSHKHGFIDPSEIPGYVAGGGYVCNVPAGGAMLMRPILLHSSRASDTESHRRVLHIEFSADELPKPLEWRWRARL